jgi:hypothetical protein
MASRSFEPLARRLCKVVHDSMEAPPHDWVALTRAANDINVTNKELIDGAVAHAVHKGWLQASGKPVKSLLLTPAGEAASIQKK